MQKHSNKFCSFSFPSLLLTLLFATLFTTTSVHIAMAAQTGPPGTWIGTTTTTANVRSGPYTTAYIVKTLHTHTRVAVYATVVGQVVWGGISHWYLISNPGSSLEYIYAGLVTRGSSINTTLSVTGKRIVINLSQQWLYAFDRGKEVFNSPVTTGQPGMDTPTGTYHVFSKLSPTTFYSPLPPSSPYYYAPTFINYALAFRDGGYFIHDATWRSDFGPHTNARHYDHVYGWETGSHGCVNLPINTMAWLYSWTPIGTTVQITT
jgi:lipoprotein-anchoring transpeptidase ErfK/SrfK